MPGVVVWTGAVAGPQHLAAGVALQSAHRQAGRVRHVQSPHLEPAGHQVATHCQTTLEHLRPISNYFYSAKVGKCLAG